MKFLPAARTMLPLVLVTGILSVISDEAPLASKIILPLAMTPVSPSVPTVNVLEATLSELSAVVFPTLFSVRSAPAPPPSAVVSMVSASALFRSWVPRVNAPASLLPPVRSVSMVSEAPDRVRLSTPLRPMPPPLVVRAPLTVAAPPV